MRSHFKVFHVKLDFNLNFWACGLAHFHRKLNFKIYLLNVPSLHTRTHLALARTTHISIRTPTDAYVCARFHIQPICLCSIVFFSTFVLHLALLLEFAALFELLTLGKTNERVRMRINTFYALDGSKHFIVGC